MYNRFEKITPCDRCGKCCFIFVHQIHYKAHELMEFTPKLVSHPLYTAFYRIKEKFKTNEDGTIKFFVPIKSDCIPLFTPEEMHDLISAPSNGDECMFLAWDSNKMPYCVIHTYKPQMCRDYPDSKGGVCLQHPERYFTHDFFEFQKKTIGLAVKVLRELYSNKIKDVRGFEVLIFLMGFGRFLRYDVQQFFNRELGISQGDFDRILQELQDYHLIMFYPSPEGELIEGISLKEVEQLVDEIMVQNKWDVPPKTQNP